MSKHQEELAQIRCELRKYDGRDIPISSVQIIRDLLLEIGLLREACGVPVGATVRRRPDGAIAWSRVSDCFEDGVIKYKEHWCLLIGGPHDGERIEASPDMQYIQLSIPAEPPAPYTFSDDITPDPSFKIETCVYVRQEWRDRGQPYFAWVYEHEHDPMGKLMEGYRRPK